VAFRTVDRALHGEVVACSTMVLFISEIVAAFDGQVGPTAIYRWVREAREVWTDADWKEIEPFMPLARARVWPYRGRRSRGLDL
jgi:hypothetical protein